MKTFVYTVSANKHGYIVFIGLTQQQLLDSWKREVEAAFPSRAKGEMNFQLYKLAGRREVCNCTEKQISVLSVYKNIFSHFIDGASKEDKCFVLANPSVKGNLRMWEPQI